MSALLGDDFGSVRVRRWHLVPLSSLVALALVGAGAIASTSVVRIGTSGPDVLTGTAGVDALDGRGGADRISGLVGNDRLIGGAGNDRLLGGAGTDRLLGGAGNDRLVGGVGSDGFDGGAGNDMLTANDKARDAIGCGVGQDVVVADLIDIVSANCEVVRRR
jgi:Ca2+-binding RTX toxin-like protein